MIIAVDVTKFKHLLTKNAMTCTKGTDEGCSTKETNSELERQISSRERKGHQPSSVRVDPCYFLLSPTCRTPPYQSYTAKFMTTEEVTAVSLTEDIWGSDVCPMS